MSARIVIAEDESDIRANLSRLLRIEGYEVWAAANGREALALVQEHLPDLLLSDVMMPEMTGHQLLQALRLNPQTAHIPAILLTARADRHDVREGMNLGADDYLTKPFQRDELLASIRSRLDRSAMQRLAAQRLAVQARRLVHYDPVTDLPNRTHFQLLLEDAIKVSGDGGQGPALWVVALDNMAEMAQVLGTSPLDDCLRQLSRRLEELGSDVADDLAARSTVARLGDDKLVMMLSALPQLPDIDALARRLQQDMEAPIAVEGSEHFPSISVGACVRPAHVTGAEILIGQLELALLAARGQPGQRVASYQALATDELSTRFRLHNDVHRAVERGELEAFFQPQVHAQDGQAVGFEALMRWRHPELGLVSPARFIPIAEDNGRIVPMGAWMMLNACLQARRWDDQLPPGTPRMRVAVNLSSRQFMEPRLIDDVEAALDISGLEPERLELEITEGTAMHDLQYTLTQLKRFKALGLRLAIDDFGTGYSSLAYLKRFPLDVLKIDQSFVRQLCTDREDQAIARAVIGLAHSLGLSVIAEGVETPEQHQLLLAMGCEEIQGYLHGRPMPAAEATAWLQAHFKARGPKSAEH